MAGIWVFGYGSLMWKIDFPVVRRITGYVEGFVRTMEWADEVHRGVPGQMSRTAAIFSTGRKEDRVWGVAYEISRDYWERVLAPKVGYRERGGYNTVETTFIPQDAGIKEIPDKILVTLYLGDKTSPYYKPGDIEELAQHIVNAVGASGTNLEYLYSTAEALRMILPPGQTDKHMFELEAAARKLEALEKTREHVQHSDVVLDEKYEKRRALLMKIYKTIDRDTNAHINRDEFQELAVNILNLPDDRRSLQEKFDDIDKNNDGKLSKQEFVDYFLNYLQEHEARFKDEYAKFGLRQNTEVNEFENALLLYEVMQDAGLNERNAVVPIDEMLQKNKKIIEKMRVVTNPKAREVIDFWFPDSIQDAMKLWFGKSSETDKIICERFGYLVDMALAGKLDDWMSNKSDTLALIVLLNQMTRAVYRGSPSAFSGDEKAQGIAATAIFRGYWKSMPPMQNIFLPCMVLATSENLHYQDLGVEIWIHFIQAKLETTDALRIIQTIFKRNHGIIKKFGRFPHRNKVLCRESTIQELEYLADNAARLDQPLYFTDQGVFERPILEDNNNNNNKTSEEAFWPSLDTSAKIESLRIDE